MTEKPISSRDDELLTRARNSFWKCAKEGFYQLVDHAPTAWKGRDARFYRAEKQLIVKHVEPFYWGGVVTLFLFATFRISGSRFYQQFRTSYLSTISAKRVGTPPGGGAASSGWTSHLEEKAAERQHLFRDSIQLPVDVLLSVMLGASSILWLSKPKQQLAQDFATSPLLPGKSLIHEHVCPIFVQAQAPFAHVMQDSNTSRMRDDDGDATVLHTFATFCQNCQLRSRVIEERRANEARPNVIPYPGIKGLSSYDSGLIQKSDDTDGD